MRRTTATMPKMKTHTGTAKRFRVTGSGKIMRRRANRAHYNEHKSSRVTRRLYNDVQVAPANARRSRSCSASSRGPYLGRHDNGTRQAIA